MTDGNWYGIICSAFFGLIKRNKYHKNNLVRFRYTAKKEGSAREQGQKFWVMVSYINAWKP